MNLVTNAIRYNRKGGRVDFSLRTGDGEAVLTVADTGIGIPDETRVRVFERFYRVDQARSRDVGGSGLGLAICKEIVEAHGGRIWVESDRGQGAAFHVVLPAATPQREVRHECARA